MPRVTYRRTRPLLGTFVAVGVGGLPQSEAEAAIAAAFAEIARIHRLMSFHEGGSDTSRLNRAAADRPVKVHPHSFAVIGRSLELAALSRGVFDVTMAPQLVESGLLPRPASRRLPDPAASWRDIELILPDRIRFHRPLWIDLGGIAKGYAVDCAIGRLQPRPDVQCTVNAGGDIRVAGPEAEPIGLCRPSGAALPVVRLENGSLASSSGAGHLHGRRRRPVGTRSFVSVVAESCVVADALTKVVLALGSRAERILRHYAATAFLHRPGSGWRSLGAPCPSA